MATYPITVTVNLRRPIHAFNNSEFSYYAGNYNKFKMEMIENLIYQYNHKVSEYDTTKNDIDNILKVGTYGVSNFKDLINELNDIFDRIEKLIDNKYERYNIKSYNTINEISIVAPNDTLAYININIAIYDLDSIDNKTLSFYGILKFYIRMS